MVLRKLSHALEDKESNMIDNQIKKKLAGKIITDPNFSKSHIYPKLLEYLIDCSIRGHSPNESDIAKCVFNKENFDSSTDPLIRVHVSKLRKKVDDYFENEGKDEEIRIIISPRHYDVEFKKNKPIHRQIWNRLSIFQMLLFAGLLAFLLIVIYYLNENRRFYKQIISSRQLAKDTFIWSDFLQSKLPTIYAIGNINFYCEYREDTKSYLLVNNPLVNDEKSLEEYIKDAKIPRHYIWYPYWEIIPKMALLDFSRIQGIFLASQHEITSKLSTKMEWEDFRRFNFIYLGHFHNLGMLKEFYNTQNINSPHATIDYKKRKALINTDSLDFILKKLQQKGGSRLLSNYLESNLQQIHVKNAEIDTVYRLIETEETNYIKDYVAVSKLPGPKDNTLLFIISMHQIGRMEVVKMLTDVELYEKFKLEVKQKCKDIPKCFEMIIQVEGFKETAMKIKLLHFFPLKQDSQK